MLPAQTRKTIDPYQPPAARLSQSAAAGVSIEGSKLVVPQGYVFPPVCPLTGEVEDLERPVTRRRVAPRAVNKGLVLLFQGPVGLLVHNVARKHELSQQYTYTFRPSRRALQRWKLYRRLGLGVLVAGLYGIGKGFSWESPWLSVAALVLVGFGIAMMGGVFDAFRVAKIKNGQLWIAGIPHPVRQKIVGIEHARVEASRKAAELYARQQQQPAAGQPATAVAPLAAAPPPVPLFFPRSR